MVKGDMMVSIVILSHLRVELTKRCLEQLLNNSVNEYEIIVINQVKELEKEFDSFSSIKVISTDKNLGVAGGRNFGAQFVNNPYVLFLDNDCTMDKDWDKDLYRILKEYDPSFLTCRLISDAVTSVNGIIDCKFLDYCSFPAELVWVVSDEKDIVEAGYVRGLSFYKLDIFNSLGQFDDTFFIGFEDVDFTLKVMKNGYKIHHTPKVVVKHLNDRTNETYNKIRVDRPREKELCKYLESKWEEDLSKGLGNAMLLDITPKEIVEKRIKQLLEGVNGYKYFNTKTIIKRAKLKHGIE